MKRRSQERRIAAAILCGLLVGLTAAGVHAANMPRERAILISVLVGDVVAALTAVIACLGIQLRHEQVHYQNAVERAAIVGELNHHIRNAIFPVFLAVEKIGDAEAVNTARASLERINLALKDATVDALSGRIEYGVNGQG